MKKIIKLFIVLILLLPAELFAAGNKRDEGLSKDFSCYKKLGGNSRLALLTEIDKEFAKVGGFSADFVQESRMLAGTRVVANKGKVSFLKPGRMNWRYDNPRQLFVSNGKTVWFYQPESEDGKDVGGEVTLVDFNSAFSSETPGSFLLGLGTLAKDFKMISGCETRAGYLAELRPHVEDENLEQFFLLVRKHDNVAIGAKIVDFSENETIIRFKGLELNPALEEKKFNFKIPRGVYIEDRRRKSALGF